MKESNGLNSQCCQNVGKKKKERKEGGRERGETGKTLDCTLKQHGWEEERGEKSSTQWACVDRPAVCFLTHRVDEGNRWGGGQQAAFASPREEKQKQSREWRAGTEEKHRRRCSFQARELLPIDTSTSKQWCHSEIITVNILDYCQDGWVRVCMISVRTTKARPIIPDQGTNLLCLSHFLFWLPWSH